jgi:hypothetical protein
VCHLLVIKIGKGGLVAEYTTYAASTAGMLAAKADAETWMDGGGVAAYVFKPGQLVYTMSLSLEEGATP